MYGMKQAHRRGMWDRRVRTTLDPEGYGDEGRGHSLTATLHDPCTVTVARWVTMKPKRAKAKKRKAR